MEDIEFETPSVISVKKDYHNQCLVYSGRENNLLKFTYLEYIGQNNTPDSEIEIKFDFLKNNILLYKNFKIEIHNATDVDIQFRNLSRI